MSQNTDFNFACPLPIKDHPNIRLAHGGGGELMNNLINDMFLTAFDNQHLHQRNDAAVFNIDKGQMALTTDSYVVSPLFFPGGDIGMLAVNGTVNDLAVVGARPVYLSLGLIIEEGFLMEKLWQIVRSVSLAAKESNVSIITGDTKVVERGKGDGIYINTCGIGVIAPNLSIAATQIEAGDAIIINGDIGRHGMAIMAARQDLGFKGTIESDCASLSMMIQDVIDAKIAVHCMRDLTRGGLASALCELSGVSKAQFEIKDNEILINEKVTALGELLGIDPIHSACEGRLVMFLPQSETEKALGIMRRHSVGAESRIIGQVENITEKGRVVLKTCYGTERLITMLSGEQLPRIC